MTKTHFDWSRIKPIPGFDCVAEKNRIQAVIYEETKNMTPEEIRERCRQSSLRMQQEKTEFLRKQQAEGE